MKRIILAVFPLFLTLLLNAQDTQNLRILKGMVVNGTDNEPIAYTNIGIEGTFYGTASNASGEFELRIPGDAAGKNILFSAVGFKNKVAPVADFAGKDNLVVKLEPQTYDIGQINVNARSKVILRILRMASEKIPANFKQGPFRVTGLYENTRTINDSNRLSRRAKAIIDDISGYRYPDKISAFRDRGYHFENVEKNFTSYSFPDGATNFDELIDLDWARSKSSVLNPGLLRTFEFGQGDDQSVGGRKVHVITFSQKYPTPEGSGEFYGTSFGGQIFIDAETYTVLKIEGKAAASRQNRQGRSLAIGKGNESCFENVTSNFTVSYTSGVPDLLTLNKSYTFKGKKISELTRFTITGCQQTPAMSSVRREYFEGE